MSKANDRHPMTSAWDQTHTMQLENKGGGQRGEDCYAFFARNQTHEGPKATLGIQAYDGEDKVSVSGSFTLTEEQRVRLILTLGGTP